MATSADRAVAPPPRMQAVLRGDRCTALIALTMPGMSVLSPSAIPSRNTTVLTASTDAASGETSSSRGMMARLSGIVSESPAHSGPHAATKSARESSVTSQAS